MSSRKIIPLGKSSLVISLPIEWLRQNNLTKGDTVEVSIQKNQALLVKPEFSKEQKETQISLTIDESEPDDSIVRIIIGCYLNGYEIITINSRTKFTSQQHQAVRNTVKSLYLRIIESTTSNIVIQTLLDEAKASVTSSIERMHIITSSMCDDVLNSMRYWDVDLARSVINLEDDVDQYLFFLLRLIRSSLIYPPLASQLEIELVDCLDWQTLIYRIEHVADHTTKTAQAIINLVELKIEVPVKIWNTMIKSAEIAFESYKQSVDYFLSMTVDHSNRLINNQREIENILNEITPLPLMGIDDRETFSHLFMIRNSIRRISEYAADIAELTIDRAYKPAT
jgi:phosphate uptake regulator